MENEGIMYELDPAEYERVRPLLGELMEYNLHLVAILEGTSKGQLYVDEIETPRTAMVATPVMVYYLGGSESNDTINRDINQRFPDNKTFYCWCGDQWQRKFDIIFEKRFARKALRRYYRLQQPLLKDWQARIPPGFSMEYVDKEFIERDLKNMDSVTGWYLPEWPSADLFFEKGFGFALVDEKAETIASWSLADYVSGNRCETGIRTDWDYRRRGFGTATVAATVEHCVTNGFQEIGWHCWSTNIGSIRISENVGFELIREYPIYLNDWAAENISDWSPEQFRAFAEDYERELAEITPNTGYPYVVTSKAWALAREFHPAIKNVHKAIDVGFLKSVDDLRKIWPEIFLYGTHHDRKEWKELLLRLEASESNA
ncbi:MAG: GNAT family N-acetyltransferase [Candidatus Hodarchaeales archaeon]